MGEINPKRAKEISATRLSRPSQKQLGWLSEHDYKEVTSMLKGRGTMPRKQYKPSLSNKVILAILRMGKGGKTKRQRVAAKKGGLTTTRTAVVSDRLKEAGLDQATIDRLRGRKKSK